MVYCFLVSGEGCQNKEPPALTMSRFQRERKRVYERDPFQVSQCTSVQFEFLKVYGGEERWNHVIKALGFSCIDSQPIFPELIESLRSLTHPPEATRSPTQMEFTTYLKAAKM